MLLTIRQNQHPHTMAILPWSTPFFPPQKRCIISFPQAVNEGTSTTPPPFIILQWKSIITITLTANTSNVGMHSWPCSPTSPCSAGAVCPVLLNGLKRVPPARAECWRMMTTLHQHSSSRPHSGPNHCQLIRCHLRRTQLLPPFYQLRH